MKIFNYKNILEKENGFTLVESLTAIFILTLAIVGLMGVVSSSLFAARYGRDEITANFLLQEAVDYIRNDRDSTVFLSGSVGSTSTAWTSFYSKYLNSQSTSGCTLDILPSLVSVASPVSCPAADCPNLYYKSNPGVGESFYKTDDGSGMSGYTKTNFKRKIVVKQNVSDVDQIDVTDNIKWKNGNLDKQRSLSTTITRWQE